jgi:putative bacteriophage DNA transposition protein A
MIYVETAAAAEIFNIHLDTLKKSAGRNSKKYPFVRIEGAGARSRGGVKLLFAVEIADIDAAINSGKIDKDMDVYLPDSAQECGYRAVKFSEFSRADEIDSENSVKAQNLVRPLKFVKGEEYGSGRDNNAAIANGLVDRRDRSRGASGARDTDASQGNEEVNAVYTVSNLEELKSGSIGLDHSGDLAAGRKNKNLDAVANRDLRNHSSSNDNRAALTRKTLDKSEVLGYAKLYGVKAAAFEYGVPTKTIYRWQKEFEKNGSKALVDKRGGVSKVDEASIKQAIFAVGTAQITSWWMVYCLHYCQKNRLKFDQYNLSSDISRATFLRHATAISKNDYEVRTFLRAGFDGFDVRPTISRSWLGINEEWQIDATKFDFMCLDEYGEAKRYTAISMVDVGSGRRVFELFDSANSYANVRLLKKALSAMGRPGYIKGDNGKDYVSKHFQGVLGRLGIVYVKAKPFAGYEKGKVERSFGQLQSFFEPLPGFLGHNAGQRMKKEAQALEKSKRLSGVKTNISNLLTKDEMQAYIDEYAEKIFFAEDVKFEPFDFDERVFGVSIKRTLQAEGFNINASKYLSLDIFRYAKLGEELELIEDIDDISKFYVYRDCEYLCEVASEEIARYSAEEVKAVQKEYRKRHIQPLIATIKSLQNSKDAYFKEAAVGKLKQAQKGKTEVIKKDEAKVVSKIEQEASVGNNVIYLPDPADAIKSLEG